MVLTELSQAAVSTLLITTAEVVALITTALATITAIVS